MGVLKIGLVFFVAWCGATGINWLVSGNIDLAGNIVVAVAVTGGVMVGDHYRRRQQAAGQLEN